MTAKETIESWPWRIKKAGMNQGDFAESIGISPQLFSTYVNGKANPTLNRFDEIENALRELGV